MRISAVSPNLYTAKKQSLYGLQKTAVSSNPQQSTSIKFGAAHALAPMSLPMALAAYNIPALFVPTIMANVNQGPSYMQGVQERNIIEDIYKKIAETPSDGGLSKSEKALLELQYQNADDLLNFINQNHVSEFKQKVQEEGVDASLANEKGLTPLMALAAKGDKELVAFLLEQSVNINLKDKFGKRALDYARDAKQVTVANMLKAAHKKQGDELIQHIQIGNLEKVEKLLKKGVDPNYAFGDAKHFLEAFYQSKQNKKELLALLLKHKVDINGFTDDATRMNPLLQTTVDGNQEMAELLLDSGANINVRNNAGYSPLFLSIKHQKDDLAELFIKRGANLNLPNGEGITPAMYASQLGNLRVLGLLISNQAGLNLVSKDGHTAVSLAAKHDQLDALKQLIDGKAKLNIGDNLPISLAIENGNPELVRVLLENGAKANGHNKQGQDSPLHQILKSKHDPGVINEIGQLLIEHGANVQHLNADQMSPLMLAAANGQTNLVLSLINKKSNLNNFDAKGLTALNYAVNGNHLPSIQLLLESGAKPNLAGTNALYPLMDAISEGYFQATKLLLKYGADPNKSKDGISEALPLGVAASRGHVEMVRELIKNGADVNLKGKKGSTALTLAAGVGSVDMVRLLLNAGADPTQKDSNGWIFGSRPIDYAKEHHNPALNKLLDITANDRIHQSENLMSAIAGKNFKQAQTLLKQGANANYVNNKGSFPLEKAVIKNDPAMARLLLASMANVNQLLPNGATVLNHAAYHGYAEMVELLLEHGIDVNKANDKGNTALINAASAGYTNILELLLDHDAEINHANNDGQTAFMHASKASQLQAAKLLIERGANVCKQDNSGWIFGKKANDYVVNHKIMSKFVTEEQAKRGC